MNFKRVLNILNPQPRIGGLEISDSDLRFFLIKGKSFVLASVKLPVGVVEGGKVKDKNNFKAALSKLHSQITSKSGKKIYAVLNIPDINIYVQAFNLPMIAAGNLDEAAELNLQMISPTDFSGVYADWQKIGEVEIDGGQLEILGAFIQRQIIDEFVECVREANFIVSAIEFSSLAVSRLISELKNTNATCLLLRLDAGGLSFSFIKNNNLCFNHFVPWPVLEKRQISMDVLKDLIIRETHKVLNFSNKHWPEAVLNNMLLIAPALEEKISQIITENFSFSVQKLTLESTAYSRLSSLTSEWFSALGSAMRGLIPRAKDVFISLIIPGTEEEFQRQRTIDFIKIWRNIVLTSLFFVLVIFIATDAFLIKTVNSLNNRLANFINQPEKEVFSNLLEEAEKFNAKMDLALQAKSQVSNFTPLFEKIKNLAGNEIIIDRIFIQSQDLPILFNGRAVNEKAIIDFKTLVEKDSEFKEVNLPLSGIASDSDGLFNFNITFKTKQ